MCGGNHFSHTPPKSCLYPRISEHWGWIHRIVELLRLERPLRPSGPSHQPTPPCPLTTHCHIHAVPRGQWLHQRLRQPVHSLTTLLERKFFLISNLNLPWCNLRPFPLVLSVSELHICRFLHCTSNVSLTAQRAQVHSLEKVILISLLSVLGLGFGVLVSHK